MGLQMHSIHDRQAAESHLPHARHQGRSKSLGVGSSCLLTGLVFIQTGFFVGVRAMKISKTSRKLIWVLALLAVILISATITVRAASGVVNQAHENPVDGPQAVLRTEQVISVMVQEDPRDLQVENLPARISPRPFGNPAGCAPAEFQPISSEAMLAGVQAALGSDYDLAPRRQTWVWNGELGTMQDISEEGFAYEFVFNEFAPPLTYLGDHVATIFLTQGFVVWFRQYNGDFRLLAIPMTTGAMESNWAGYLNAYWQADGMPQDEFIFPVMRKLPCHWAVEQGYVSEAELSALFNLDWQIPDYLSAGRQYLADTCEEANRISREVIGFWDASSMCGPLTWTIMRDAASFPYRIGAWSASAAAFTASNPRWNAQPWASFDPETYSLQQITTPMSGYDFSRYGDLHTGDIVYSFSTLYVTEGFYDHIFMVAGVDDTGARLSITNMVRSYPTPECSISEVRLYTPGDRETGVINHEWNGFGYGRTGTTGFDIFRWNWITYRIEGQPMDYTVRWGDTLETIAFDWKVSPESLQAANGLNADTQLLPGQLIHLPSPTGGFE